MGEDVQAELMESKRALMATRGELLKAQVVAATRLDVIRLLAIMSNRPGIPDLSALTPNDPAARALLAIELRELVAHMRVEASKYEQIALELDVSGETS